MAEYSQYIADNSNTPHVCSVSDGLIINHLWSHKLWRAKQDFERSGCLYTHMSAKTNSQTYFNTICMFIILGITSNNRNRVKGFTLTQSACQSKVNEFDFAASFIDTHDVLRFEVQVDDAFLMDKIHTIHYLQHVFDHFSLR